MNFEQFWFNYNLLFELKFAGAFITCALESAGNRHCSLETNFARTVHFGVARKSIVNNFLLSGFFRNFLWSFFCKFTIKSSNKCFIEIIFFYFNHILTNTRFFLTVSLLICIGNVTRFINIIPKSLLPSFIHRLLCCKKLVH